MQLENIIFNKFKPNISELIDYGFIKKNDYYFYQTNFFNNKFQAQILINNDGKITGKVIDRDLNDEYLPIHTMQTGKFIDQVRNDYLTILKDIQQNCFTQISIYPNDPKHYWLIPANPKYYDIMHAFNKTDTIIWKQSTKIKPGDIIFMYVASPISAIIYQCQVLKVNLPYNYQSKNLKINHVMQIKRIISYPVNKFTFKKLASFGVRAIRGPRHVPQELLSQLLKNA